MVITLFVYPKEVLWKVYDKNARLKLGEVCASWSALTTIHQGWKFSRRQGSCSGCVPVITNHNSCKKNRSKIFQSSDRNESLYQVWDVKCTGKLKWCNLGLCLPQSRLQIFQSYKNYPQNEFTFAEGFRSGMGEIDTNPLQITKLEFSVYFYLLVYLYLFKIQQEILENYSSHYSTNIVIQIRAQEGDTSKCFPQCSAQRQV